MLIFVHIPKTGGTALRASLAYQKKYVSLSHEDSFEWMAERSNGCDVAAGHIPFGLHNYINEPFEYITVLRHPAERIMSKYNMPAPARTVTPEEFVAQSHRFKNLATRQLCGLGLNYDGDITEEHYNLALSNLKTIKYIGTTRQLGSLWDKIRHDNGLNVPLYHHSASRNPRNNHSKINHKLEALSSIIIDGIIKYNEWDLKLFEEAQRLSK